VREGGSFMLRPIYNILSDSNEIAGVLLFVLSSFVWVGESLVGH
jgi:hypothetical protein